ncbi:MAG TPA: imidazole glycerol phosphate synthase subunit HisH [Gemmatimonadaceae bacterium]|nr:imidazole glycerol phosphate synthase subunit HisH [Gemmatimonadaceae bacterium]
MSRTRLAIFDYGAGNLHSLVKAITRGDRVISIETDLASAINADMLVLPGVGAFGAAARAMAKGRSSLASALEDGLPCLGICLGMQLLFDASEEGEGDGVGFIAGNVTRLRTPTVPHMGWNEIDWRDVADSAQRRLESAYFANAYICQPEDSSVVLASTTHQNATFASIVRRANTVGVQFHPEKSSAAGVAFINDIIDDLIRPVIRESNAVREAITCK